MGQNRRRSQPPPGSGQGGRRSSFKRAGSHRGERSSAAHSHKTSWPFGEDSKDEGRIIVGDDEPHPERAALRSPVERGKVVVTWALSLNHLLDHPNGLAQFMQYCTELLCQENLLFWQAVEDFKIMYDEEVMQEKAHEIYEDFITSRGQHQVNLSGKTAKALAEALSKPITKDLFNTSQNEIFVLMKTDSYGKFLQSDLYKSLLCLEIDGKPLPWEDSNRPRKKLASIRLSLKRGKDRRKSTLPTTEGIKPPKDDHPHQPGVWKRITSAVTDRLPAAGRSRRLSAPTLPVPVPKSASFC